MEIKREKLSGWGLSPKEAVKHQESLKSLVIKENRFGKVSKIAGVDASYKSGLARVAVVVLSYPGLRLIDRSCADLPVSFPYVPGLLAFREGPAVVEAFRALKTEPDLIIFDSQGLAHPRRLGLASHLGVILNKPSIGCAKSRLVGGPGSFLPDEKGSFVDLLDGGEVIGRIVRSKEGEEPLYVSVGHQIDLVSAVVWLLNCVKAGERLPETTRQAHRLAGDWN